MGVLVSRRQDQLQLGVTVHQYLLSRSPLIQEFGVVWISELRVESAVDVNVRSEAFLLLNAKAKYDQRAA